MSDTIDRNVVVDGVVFFISRTRSRYKRKLPEERKKRGPKPNPTKVPQTCYECNKTFKCAAQLQLHIRTHSGER